MWGPHSSDGWVLSEERGPADAAVVTFIALPQLNWSREFRRITCFCNLPPPVDTPPHTAVLTGCGLAASGRAGVLRPHGALGGDHCHEGRLRGGSRQAATVPEPAVHVPHHRARCLPGACVRASEREPIQYTCGSVHRARPRRPRLYAVGSARPVEIARRGRVYARSDWRAHLPVRVSLGIAEERSIERRTQTASLVSLMSHGMLRRARVVRSWRASWAGRRICRTR